MPTELERETMQRLEQCLQSEKSAVLRAIAGEVLMIHVKAINIWHALETVGATADENNEFIKHIYEVVRKYA